jgi:hypothetical protein
MQPGPGLVYVKGQSQETGPGLLSTGPFWLTCSLADFTLVATDTYLGPVDFQLQLLQQVLYIGNVNVLESRI